MIKILLEAGANPNCHNGSNTASGLAARSGDLDALKLLIDAGADPKSIAPNGTDDALSWARGMGHEHIVAYLEGKGVANTNWLWMLAAIVVIVLIISVNLG